MSARIAAALQPGERIALFASGGEVTFTVYKVGVDRTGERCVWLTRPWQGKQSAPKKWAMRALQDALDDRYERAAFKQGRADLKRLGVELRRTAPGENEYRVNRRGGTEAAAYYTNDIDDAIATGRTMVRGAK